MKKKDYAISLLKWLDDKYHNDRVSVIPDRVYDALREKWSKEFKHPYFKSVGAPVKSDKKITLERVMPHLSKRRPLDALKWVLSCGIPLFYITPKMDGISIDITYEGGKLVLATTRGNSSVGENVTQHIKNIGNVPTSIKNKKHIIFSGELIIRPDTFKKKYHKSIGGTYKAPRNFVGGQLNADLDKDTLNKLKEIDFICFGVWSPNINFKYKSSALEFANTCGFTTVNDLPKAGAVALTAKEVQSGAWTDKDFIKLLKQWKSEIPYEQDGLVIEADKTSDKKKLGDLNVKHPEWSYAIKLDVEDQDNLIGTVDHVEYNMTVRQLYPPVAILKGGLDFNGAEVSRASIYNAQTVSDWGIGPGARVKMIRSGDVIPRIVGVKKAVKPQLIKKCVWCDTKLHWTHTGNGLYCPNTECDGLDYVRLHHFIGNLDIDDISWGVVDKLYEAGITSPILALKASPKSLEKIDGIGKSVSNTFCKGVKSALRGIKLSHLMYSSGLFNTPMQGLGDKRLTLILDTLGQKDMIKLVTGGKVTKSKLQAMRDKLFEVKGLGKSTIDLFIVKLPSFMSWLSNIKDYVTIALPEKPKTGKLTGMQFCFTNWRNKDLEKLITDNGGLVGGIKKTTTALLYAGHSGKVDSAKSWKVKLVKQSEAQRYIEGLLA